MGEGPDPEGNKPTETNSTGFQNCKISSHYRHVASVGIPKWARFWTAVDQRRNESADVPALLDRDLSYAWQRSAALRGSGGIADNEYPRLVGYLRPDCLRIRERLETGGMVGKLVMTEIARSHSSGEH